ncbi:MAG: hypothetical protein KGZ33_01820 [Alkaliphilus sp.]|nr:hypothetical protein [Alkaliphilus sp.]MBS3994505.1 hypothetical protein [Alkaliphilus sp.]
MDSIIKKIFELDQQAVDIKEKTKEMEDNNIENIKKVLLDLDTKAIDEAKKLGKEKYQAFIDEGEARKQEITVEAEHACELLEKKFSNSYRELEEEIFREIFKK